MAKDWQTLAKEKRESVLALIPEEWRIKSIPPIEEVKDITGSYIEQHLSPKEIEITNTDAVGIVSKTKSGSWSAVEVTKAFCHRAALAHQLLNCLHEIFFDAAIKDAEGLDKLYAEGKETGPLHGLPVSLKDQFHVKDVETSMGYVGWLDSFQGLKDDKRAKTFESEMVTELRSLGAVLYVKTSVPHTLMCGETVNNIIDYTYNPKNRLLSCGGSSGGEGALIGARGSPLGFGTDIGGSIRIPSAFNGLFGLRPSSGRLPYEGMANSMEGQNTILSVVGPLATTPGALKLVTQALLTTKPWLQDPMVVEMPWRPEQAELPEKLCIGVLYNDGAVIPSPPVKRALDMTVSALQSAGHTIVPWIPPPHSELVDAGFKAFSHDAGKDLYDAFALAGEPPKPQVAAFIGDGKAKQSSPNDIMANNVQQRELKKKYMDYWNSTAKETGTGRSVDAILCPCAPFPAARPGMYAYYGYTVFVNLLDYTSVVVPVTTVDKNVDVKEEREYKDDVDKQCAESYDAEIFDGAHVSVQFVGRRLQEEKMLAIAEMAAKALAASK